MQENYIVLIGLQWGDEGKGKLAYSLIKEYDVGIRFQGGANAGHTVYKNGEKIVLHQIPSSIIDPEKEAFISCGCVLDMEELLKEIEELKSKNINPEGRLFIDKRTALVLPFHKEEDTLENEKHKKDKIGTTKKGIGPAYRDLINRKALKVGDLEYPDQAYKKFKNLWEWNSALIGSIFGRPIVPMEEMFEKILSLYEKIKGYLDDVVLLIRDREKKNKRMMLEGAQGALLDIFMGTYPFVTSSHTLPASISLSTGIAPYKIKKIIGVVKSYTTRVGEGPFPTEEKGETGEKLREIGNEYGATTRRPRRCGWLDLPLLKYAIRITGTKELIITKLDVLAKMEKIKVCIKYNYKNKEIEFPPPLTEELYKVEPVYKEFNRFEPDEKDENLKKFLNFIEEQTHTKIIYISASKDEELKKFPPDVNINY